MINLFNFLVYAETPGIAGGKGNLIAGFKTGKDAQLFINAMNENKKKEKYYIVEREG